VQVLYHDPSIPELCLEEGKGVLRSQPITGALLEEADCVLILYDNPRFDYEAIVRDARSVFDACNATRGVTGREKITRL
jgi:UDP-N-acetyl-D-glucosamine dehydrogenase